MSKMTIFQYNSSDSTKHTLKILEHTQPDQYKVLVDGIEMIVDQNWLDNIIVSNRNENIGSNGKSMIFG